jgi:hypothetical protein
MGVSAIVGLGNKSDIAEHDLLTFFEQDDATKAIAMHMEDLKDGRAFSIAAKRVSKKKPVIVLKAGARIWARAASSHTGALAGNDAVYESVLRQSGVIRARGLNEMLAFARAVPILPTPKGENVVIITGAGGSGVLLSDSCVDAGLSLMKFPADLDEAFKNSFHRSGLPEIPSISRAASRRSRTKIRFAWGSKTIASTRSSWATGTRSSPHRWFSQNSFARSWKSFALAVSTSPSWPHWRATSKSKPRASIFRPRRSGVSVQHRDAGCRGRRQISLGAGSGPLVRPLFHGKNLVY